MKYKARPSATGHCAHPPLSAHLYGVTAVHSHCAKAALDHNPCEWRLASILLSFLHMNNNAVRGVAVTTATRPLHTTWIIFDLTIFDSLISISLLLQSLSQSYKSVSVPFCLMK